MLTHKYSVDIYVSMLMLAKFISQYSVQFRLMLCQVFLSNSTGVLLTAIVALSKIDSDASPDTRPTYKTGHCQSTFGF